MTVTNNTITEIKNTLEGINNRISEAEKQICDLEDKMVETTFKEQNKVKRMKRTEDSSQKSQRLLGQHQTHQHSNYMGYVVVQRNQHNLVKQFPSY